MNYKKNEYKKDLKEEWIKFLYSYPWELFIVLTFKDDISLRKAKNFWNRWLRIIEKKTHKTPKYFKITSYQKRGVIHFHVLMFNVKAIRRLTFMDIWKEMTQGYARVEPYEEEEKGVPYIVKRLEEVNYLFSANIQKRKGLVIKRKIARKILTGGKGNIKE